MRFAPLLAAALLLGSCDFAERIEPAAASEASSEADTTQLGGALEAALADSAAGWNAGDMTRFMAIYSAAPETSFVTAEGLLRGREAMAGRYAERYDFSDAAARGDLAFETLDVRPLGENHALYIGRYILTYPEAEPASGVTTLVFARENGAWKIIADHSS